LLLNKLLPKSPLGVFLTAAAVAFTISPEARKMTRRMAVKGLAGVLSVVDQLKASSSALQGQWKELLAEAKQSDFEQHPHVEQSSMDDTDREPVPVGAEKKELSPAFNVLDDGYLKKQYVEFEKPH
jgi:hypothetical protein